MNPKYRRTVSFVWAYLNQPLGDQHQPTVFNPKRFFYLYQIRYLERCFHSICPSNGGSRNGADGSSY
ncbi:MAG: hypothetical protein IGR76_04900 [Synechococcales cyanobacterium T60_A2020_003]|nr:hypothetical protein [Synechococcales cyanobacterium T60_A2020_003]